MTQDQLIEAYKTARLYIDFGPFPGAERIPKEAVLFGCNILTGLHGSSAFYADVPILAEYKIDETQTDMLIIGDKIRYCLQNYDSIYHDFDEYRNTVFSLEQNFIRSLCEVFQI